MAYRISRSESSPNKGRPHKVLTLGTVRRSYLLVALLAVFFGACTRDEPAGPSDPSAPVDGRTKFVGTYDVYDTLSNWLYEMEISPHSGATNVDSVHIANWGGAFDFYAQQDDGNLTNYLNMSGQFGIADHAGNHWALYREHDTLFNNRLVNDTLRLSYGKDNIAFYVADGVPYFSQSYREYAVKRDWE